MLIVLAVFYYTIPRNNRELQLNHWHICYVSNYTIPRNNRELQLCSHRTQSVLIIPYQEIIGNYSKVLIQYHAQEIIPYQEIIGNYSSLACPRHAQMIIPYQEIIGNYSFRYLFKCSSIIIPYQEIIGNYSCQGWYGILESLSIPQNKKIPLLRII